VVTDPGRGSQTPEADLLSLTRQRLPQLGLFMAAVVLSFEVLRAVIMTFGSGYRLEVTTLLLLATALCFLALWLFGRQPGRSLAFLQALECLVFLIGTVGACLLLWSVPGPLRPELPIALVLVVALLVRGTYIPSTVRRSLVIAGFVCVPFLAAVLYKYGALEPPPQAVGAYAGGNPLLAVVGIVGLFFIVATAVSAGTSHTIYGLQRQVRQLRQMGQYVLGEMLGQGGMGVVYRAQHALLRRPTAIKLLPRDQMGGRREERFEREVQLTARLSHPNTVTVFDFGRTPDGVFYYAMELLEGAELGKVVEVAGRMPPARVAKIMADVAGALAEAHELGLVHRDIKSANIMLCWRGGKPDVTKVLDFGLAKDIGDVASPALTGTGVLTGTPLYLAPEMVTAPDTVSAASDLYALGCVGYFLLTGETVFTAQTAVEIAAHHVRTPPTPPSQRIGQPIAEPLERVILACLEKDPGRRPANARHIEHDLLPLASGWTEEAAHRFWAEYGHQLHSTPCQQPSRPPAPIAIDIKARAARALHDEPERHLARTSAGMARASLDDRRSSRTSS
jgi:eukaryotic-like serine/threonine-protein kinase